jgi:hypothetical protein
MSFMPLTAVSGADADLAAAVLSAMAIVGASCALQFEG